MSNIVATNFVEPHFIEELGEDGLTSTEIATSIAMQKGNLHRLAESLASKGFLELSQIEKVKNHLGQTVTDYLFTVEDAKLLVTQSSTAAGIGYCRYLIQVEKQARELANNPAKMFEGMSSDQLQAMSVLTAKLAEEQKKIIHMSKVTNSALSTAAKQGRILAEITKEKERLEEKLGEAGMWLTTHAILKEYPKAQQFHQSALGRQLTKLSKDMGRKIKQVETTNPRYPTQNAYHRAVIEAYLAAK